jgi:hypothetical protein
MSTLQWKKIVAGYYETKCGTWAAEFESAQELWDRGYDREDCKARWQLIRIGPDTTCDNDVRDAIPTLAECKSEAQRHSDNEARWATIRAEHEAAKREVAA